MIQKVFTCLIVSLCGRPLSWCYAGLVELFIVKGSHRCRATIAVVVLMTFTDIFHSNQCGQMTALKVTIHNTKSICSIWYHAKETERQKPWKKQKKTDRVWVYLVRLRGGGGLRGHRGVRLSVGVLRGGLVVLIGSIRGRDNRPCRLNWSWSIGCRHCMSNSRGRLDAVGGCRGMGVGWGRLSTAEGWSKLWWRVTFLKRKSKDVSTNSR